MNIAFDGMKENMVTFEADTGLTTHTLCKMTGNGKVGNCLENDRFCGRVISQRTGFASVQIDGYIKAAYTGETAPAPGYQKLNADGNGGVKVNAEATKDYLVLDVDTTNKIVGFML